METLGTGTMPRLDAYLHVARGPQQERQAYGLGLVVTDGSFETVFAGNGYASDGDFPRVLALYELLDRIPDNPFRVFTTGVTEKLRHWRKGNGRRSDGGKFVGDEYLGPAATAVDQKRLLLSTPPHSFTPPYQRAKFAARDALKALSSNPASRNYGSVIAYANVSLDFREVVGGQDGLQN